jgi:hypothetical protein
MFSLDLAINGIFMVDIIINFFLAYYDSDFNIVDEPKVG